MPPFGAAFFLPAFGAARFFGGRRIGSRPCPWAWRRRLDCDLRCLGGDAPAPDTCERAGGAWKHRVAAVRRRPRECSLYSSQREALGPFTVDRDRGGRGGEQWTPLFVREAGLSPFLRHATGLAC